VSLRFTTDASGVPLGQSRNEHFGPPIYNKNEVEERIRRAQRAILNPSKPIKDFLNDDEDMPVEKTELSFSHNCVSLQIRAVLLICHSVTSRVQSALLAIDSHCSPPGLHEGLIASVGFGGNENDIKLVESLVTSYIKKPSCIILLTVACQSQSPFAFPGNLSMTNLIFSLYSRF